MQIVSKLYIILFIFVSFPPIRQNTENHNPVHDLLPISGDTLIAAKWYGGMVLTYNAGKTWKFLSPDLLIKTMTIDNKGVLWGMDSWQGIHESDYSRLHKSINNGKARMATAFDTQKFFPLEIFSSPH